MPVTTQFHGEHFLVRAGSTASHEVLSGPVIEDPAVEHVKPGTLMLTLALALIVVETRYNICS